VGATLFQAHCTQCHGAPGRPPKEFALGMMPAASNLVASARDRRAEEIYAFVSDGLKMTGMPAWRLRMSKAEMWRITAFVEALPELSPANYDKLVAAGEGQSMPEFPPVAVEQEGPDPERGRLAMRLYACRTCHEIPGLVGRPDVAVGPPLENAAQRSYIAGVLRNTPENMVRWIMSPQEVDPASAMPDLGVPESLARDMAAHLYESAGLSFPGE